MPFFLGNVVTIEQVDILDGEKVAFAIFLCLSVPPPPRRDVLLMIVLEGAWLSEINIAQTKPARSHKHKVHITLVTCL